MNAPAPKRQPRSRAVSKKEFDAARMDLARALASLGDAHAVSQSFDELFTPSELQLIVMRWLLMRKLRAGETQRAIAKELGLSLCKITRGSRILKSGGSVLARLLDAAPEEKKE